MAEIETIKVYYPNKLKVKQGYSDIRIHLKKFLFWGFIELEGAQGYANVVSDMADNAPTIN